MPEGTEIDIDRLQETIHEPPTDSLLRNIALTTALLAAFGAGSVDLLSGQGDQGERSGGIAGDLDCSGQGSAGVRGPVDSALCR